MIKKAPIIFSPYLKPVVWGGEKICKIKGISQEEPNIGESWEISALPGYESTVVEGDYKGKNLQELVDTFGEELLGKNVIEKYGKIFPLLIKFIDANQNLSVQVHPDDRLAKERHGSLGKSEMWYIVEAEKDAKIISGMKSKISLQEFESKVNDGTFIDSLAIHDSQPGDVFFLPAGRVHSIGAGNFLTEIQESSDITYRIYDYNRKDSAGNPRELHTTQAKEAIDYTVYDNYKSHFSDENKDITELVNCEHFKTKKIKVNGKKDLMLDNSSFLALICVKGNVDISCEEGNCKLSAGHTALIPASVTNISLDGQATLLSAGV